MPDAGLGARPRCACRPGAVVAELRTRAAEHGAQVLRGKMLTNLVKPAVLSRSNRRIDLV